MDIPVTHRGRRQFCLPLLVIPGPDEPANLAPYLKNTLDAFARYGPGGEAMKVTQHMKQADGSVGKVPMEHRIFLGAVAADTPANRKLSLFMSHASYQGCPYCWLRGTRGPTGGMYFKGYAAPTTTGCPQALKTAAPSRFGSVPAQANCGDESIKLSSLQQMARIAALTKAQQGKSASVISELEAAYGVHGLSSIISELGAYADINNLWQVPVAHAALLGIIKKFFQLTMQHKADGNALPRYVFKPAARKVITARAPHVVLTGDFNRPYR